MPTCLQHGTVFDVIAPRGFKVLATSVAVGDGVAETSFMSSTETTNPKPIGFRI